MNESEVLQLLSHGNQLKRTTRTGWAQRGVAEPENVAAHSYGVLFTTIILAHYITPPVDLERALLMAALHDLPEGLTSDIPAPAWRFLPPGIKTAVERQALQEILAEAPQAAELLACWEELHDAETPAARLVHDADKLDLYLQAHTYEQQTGNRRLDEFWAQTPAFHFVQAQRLYEALISLREQE